MATIITSLQGIHNEGWTVCRAALGGTDRQDGNLTASSKEGRNNYEPGRKERSGSNFDILGLHT